MKDLRRENVEEKNFCQQSVGGERTSASFHARLNLGIWPDATKWQIKTPSTVTNQKLPEWQIKKTPQGQIKRRHPVTNQNDTTVTNQKTSQGQIKDTSQSKSKRYHKDNQKTSREQIKKDTTVTNQYAWHKFTKIDNILSNFHPIWNIVGRPLHASSPIPDILGYLAVDIVCSLKTSRPRLSVNLWRSPSIPSVTSGRSLPAYLESASTNTVRPSLPARSRCFFCNTAVFLGQQSTPNLTKRWISIFLTRLQRFVKVIT